MNMFEIVGLAGNMEHAEKHSRYSRGTLGFIRNELSFGGMNALLQVVNRHGDCSIRRMMREIKNDDRW